jgi:MinD superfamily P-loop ATPase
MERVLKLSAHFGIPARVVINKANLDETTEGTAALNGSRE